MKISFALRQQYFHKCTILLIHHNAGFSKGIILNRPTALTLPGMEEWGYVRCGGDVEDGGLFGGGNGKMNSPRNKRKSMLSICCLHKLESKAARSVSTAVIEKKVYYCDMAAANELVESGAASRDDFCIFVGYAGWAPGQLQEELDRKSWYLSAADGETIIDEMLRKEPIPRVTDSFNLERGGDGIDTWNRQMVNIGRGAQVDHEYTFDDLMLRLWVRMRLSGSEQPEQHWGNVYKNEDKVEVGTLLLSTPFSTFALSRQYMHKALILIVENTQQYSIGIILNRPLNTIANFIIPGSDGDPEERRVSFGGEMFNNDAVLLLHRHEELGGRQVGNSGIYQLKEDFTGTIHDLVLTRGFTIWEGQELQRQVDRGVFCKVNGSAVPWEDLWELSGPTAGNAIDLNERIEDIEDSEKGLSAEVDARVTDRLLERGIDIWQRSFSNFLNSLSSGALDAEAADGSPGENRKGPIEQAMGDLPDGIVASNELGDAALKRWIKMNFE